MYKYNKFVLSNGLRFIHLEDKSRTTIVLNTLYNVGARDENKDKTGFAHLFEHLMFSGSENVAVFDKEVEEAGGQNNAFTDNEITNYYLVMPAENAETAFWLESDRMMALNINEKSLNVQRNVVIEEFKQRCFNAPFGMLWHHVRNLIYTQSSYKWPTIGEKISHIEEATLDEVKSFYDRFYTPQNAIISVVGNISLANTQKLANKWFGDISKNSPPNKNVYVKEQPIQGRRFFESTDLSPNPAVFLVWRGPVFSNPQSLHLELFSEMLGGSDVSPLQMELVKKQQFFNAAECFYLRGLGEGLFVLYGSLNDGISHQDGEKALLNVLLENSISTTKSAEQLEGVINRQTTNLLFDATQPMQLAQHICYWEHAGNLDGINSEVANIEKTTLTDVLLAATATLNPDTVSVIYYYPKQ